MPHIVAAVRRSVGSAPGYGVNLTEIGPLPDQRRVIGNCMVDQRPVVTPQVQLGTSLTSSRVLYSRRRRFKFESSTPDLVDCRISVR
jgi:hypothetical protein